MGYGDMAEQQLDSVFSALADPTRRAILARLAQGDRRTGNPVPRHRARPRCAPGPGLPLLDGARAPRPVAWPEAPDDARRGVRRPPGRTLALRARRGGRHRVRLPRRL